MSALSEFLKKILLKIFGGVGGLAGWLVGLVIDKIVSSITSVVKTWWAKRERDKKDQQQEAAYNEEIKKPDATVEEIRQAGDDFLNRRDP